MVWFLKRNSEKSKKYKSKEKPCRDKDKDKVEPALVRTVPRARLQIARGPKSLFMEDIRYNLSLLSQRLPDSNLAVEHYQIGTRSKTKVAIAFLSDLANPGLVSEIKDRIKAVRAEILPDASYLERNIEDSHLSPFPQLEKTNRPDVSVSALVQGRIAVFTDGSPDVLLAPVTLFDLLDTPEDAYRRWFVASGFFRLARLAMLAIATFLPAFYIALTSFNPELIPTSLAFVIASSREGVPFPIYLEAFIMMGVAEAVRMVMLRMPSAFGQTVALFTGLTLVGAGLAINIISAPVVIVATLTVLASMSIPNFDLRSSIRITQFFTMFMAALAGIFGFSIAFFYITIHLIVLKSFGIPYLTPWAPAEPSGWGHTILRKNSETMPRDETYKPVLDGKK